MTAHFGLKSPGETKTSYRGLDSRARLLLPILSILALDGNRTPTTNPVRITFRPHETDCPLYNTHGHKLRFPPSKKAQFVTECGIQFCRYVYC